MIGGLDYRGSLPVVTPLHPHALGPYLLAAGQDLGGTGSGVWPAASRALLIPMRWPERATLRRLGLVNGSAVSGNLDVGLYDASGNRLVSSGSVAQAGTNVVQWLDITDTEVLPDIDYYLAAVLDNVAGAAFRWATGLVTYGLAAAGLREVATAFPLPATLTPSAAITTAYVPVVLASMRTV